MGFIEHPKVFGLCMQLCKFVMLKAELQLKMRGSDIAAAVLTLALNLSVRMEDNRDLVSAQRSLPISEAFYWWTDEIVS
jgi:hypothetical protein